MTWIEHHRESEQYASEAEIYARLGDEPNALAMYKKAAAAEKKALQEVNTTEKSRTYGITALSAVALYYKAKELDVARRLAHQCLSVEQLSESVSREIEDILDSIKMRDIGLGDEQMIVSASGGEIIRGGGPLDIMVKKAQQMQALLYRTTEYLMKVPLRKRGTPDQRIQGSYRPWIFQAEPGSYRFKVALQSTRQLDMLEENIPSEQIVGRLFDILKVCATSPSDELPKVVPDHDYAGTFLKMTRDLAPTPKGRFTQLDIRSSSADDIIVLHSNIRIDISCALRNRQTPPPDRKQETVRGILRALHLDQDWIEVSINDPSTETVRIDGAGDEVDDRIGPMVNQRVVVQVERVGEKRNFIDIEEDDE